MAAIRTSMLVLAIVHALFVGLTALMGAFGDGGDIWSRLPVVLIHPLCAVGMLALFWTVALIMVVKVAADLSFAQLITSGSVKGDRWLPPMFSLVQRSESSMRSRCSEHHFQPSGGHLALAAP